jgi:hypothetical protein
MASMTRNAMPPFAAIFVSRVTGARGPMETNSTRALAASNRKKPVALSSNHSPPLVERPDRSADICASWSGFGAIENIKPRQYRLTIAKPGTRLDVSQQR